LKNGFLVLSEQNNQIERLSQKPEPNNDQMFFEIRNQPKPNPTQIEPNPKKLEPVATLISRTQFYPLIWLFCSKSVARPALLNINPNFILEKKIIRNLFINNFLKIFKFHIIENNF
jgi:hypothetical protein